MVERKRTRRWQIKVWDQAIHVLVSGPDWGNAAGETGTSKLYLWVFENILDILARTISVKTERWYERKGRK